MQFTYGVYGQFVGAGGRVGAGRQVKAEGLVDGRGYGRVELFILETNRFGRFL
jgi:hypothetical protein